MFLFLHGERVFWIMGKGSLCVEEEAAMEMLPVLQTPVEPTLPSFFSFMAVNNWIINAGLLLVRAASETASPFTSALWSQRLSESHFIWGSHKLSRGVCVCDIHMLLGARPLTVWLSVWEYPLSEPCDAEIYILGWEQGHCCYTNTQRFHSSSWHGIAPFSVHLDSEAVRDWSSLKSPILRDVEKLF